MFVNFYFLCFVHFLLLNTSKFNVVEGSQITASTNITRIQTGHPFKLKCEIENFVLGNEQFNIWFEFEINNGFAHFEVPGTIILYLFLKN